MLGAPELQVNPREECVCVAPFLLPLSNRQPVLTTTAICAVAPAAEETEETRMPRCQVRDNQILDGSRKILRRLPENGLEASIFHCFFVRNKVANLDLVVIMHYQLKIPHRNHGLVCKERHQGFCWGVQFPEDLWVGEGGRQAVKLDAWTISVEIKHVCPLCLLESDNVLVGDVVGQVECMTFL